MMPVSPANLAAVIPLASGPDATAQGLSLLAAANNSTQAALELVQLTVYELSLQSSVKLVQGLLPALGTQLDTYA